jgi:hypothetical protein
MIDFDVEFKKFHGEIDLDPKIKKQLIGSRDALREKIKTYFKDKNIKQPKFYMQGSFHMRTTIKPINGEYDLDDGIYLQNIDTSEDIGSWVSTQTVHSWIVNPVENHTSVPITDKNLCVRVNYKDKKKHIDLPIYAEKDGTFYLAVKSKGWIESNPKAIQDWFIDEVKKKGEQFRRVVKYLKAWKDYKNSSFGGFQLTVLVSNHFAENDSDEESFYQTVFNIHNNLANYRYKIPNPIDSTKNIIDHYLDGRKNDFQKEFKKLYDLSRKAFFEKESCLDKVKQWEKVFGDRFPTLTVEECKKKEKKAQTG